MSAQQPVSASSGGLSDSPRAEPSPRTVLYSLVGLALHLAAGLLIVVSRLIVTGGTILVMAAVWVVFLVTGIATWRRKPWLTILLAVIAFIMLIVAVVVGR